ncbi:hypothetical protein ZWY2020_003791 [Hordeum vulgare]|nr:hypothetical protein ZWY2020_003791 [Hordeum vulgare]
MFSRPALFSRSLPLPLSTPPAPPRTLAPPLRRATTSPTSPSSAAASSPPARPTPSSSSPPAAPLPPPLLFILIALLLVFTVFAFVVTNRGAGSVVSGRGAGSVVSSRGYREYRHGEYSTWLQRRVEDADNWARICAADSGVCQRLAPGSRSSSSPTTSPDSGRLSFAAFNQSLQFCC